MIPTKIHIKVLVLDLRFSLSTQRMDANSLTSIVTAIICEPNLVKKKERKTECKIKSKVRKIKKKKRYT